MANHLYIVAVLQAILHPMHPPLKRPVMLHIGSIYRFIAAVVLLASFAIAPNTACGNHPTTGFTENKGQVHNQHGQPHHAVRYLWTSPGLNVQLHIHGYSYDTWQRQPDGSYAMHRMDVRFLGASNKVELLGLEPSEMHTNYYRPG
jgi:hypothetical protein